MAIPSQLSLYNGALDLCRERHLASLSEVREARRKLDSAWNDGRIVSQCLEKGFWSFATRSVQLDFDPSISPSFGYKRAFVQPDDYVNTIAICSDEYFKQSLENFSHENGYFYASIDTIYIKYASNHADYGMNYTLWTESFTELVKAALAEKIVRGLTQSSEIIQDVVNEYEKQRKEAIARDAIKQAPSHLPTSSLVRARMGGRSGY